MLRIFNVYYKNILRSGFLFGYVTPLKPELKIREYESFKSYYCGICMHIKENFGNIPRMSLNYDMTFLGLLLDGLHKEAYRYFCIHHDKIRFYMGVLQHHTNFFQKNHKISYKDTLKFVKKFKDFLILGDSGWGLIREYSPISHKINYEIDINE